MFRSESFLFDAERDEFVCPTTEWLTFRWSGHERTDNGYSIQTPHYKATACPTCPLKPECTRAKGNRRLRVSFRLRQFRQQGRDNLTSEHGQALRKQRSVEVESVFGHIKHNARFRRFHLRGLEKVTTEWGLVCIARNLRKLAAQ